MDGGLDLWMSGEMVRFMDKNRLSAACIDGQINRWRVGSVDDWIDGYMNMT